MSQLYWYLVLVSIVAALEVVIMQKMNLTCLLVIPMLMIYEYTNTLVVKKDIEQNFFLGHRRFMQ